jgi:hypothetical protein
MDLKRRGPSEKRTGEVKKDVIGQKGNYEYEWEVLYTFY